MEPFIARKAQKESWYIVEISKAFSTPFIDQDYLPYLRTGLISVDLLFSDTLRFSQ